MPNGGCLQRHQLGLGTNQNQDQRYIFLNYSARGGGVNKPVLFMKIREENLYPVDFSCFAYKILVFQTFFEKLQLKNVIKSYYWGGLSKKRQIFSLKKSSKRKVSWGRKPVPFEEYIPLIRTEARIRIRHITMTSPQCLILD